MQVSASEDDRQRLDRWLWHARFFRSRALATAAVAGGHVHLNGERAKPAKALKPGDVLEITLGQRVIEVTVLTLLDRRGPAAEAQVAYAETEASQARGERERERRREAASAPRPERRPGKHERRELDRLRRQQG